MQGNDNRLSDKQALFCAEYLKDLNATQAAIRAGYAVKSARTAGARLMANKAVRAYIAETMEERNQAAKIDAQWVLERLAEVHARCMQEVKPALDRRGKQLTDDSGAPLFTFNAAAANRSLELIGKHVDVAAFEDRVKVNGELSVVELLQAGRDRIRQAKVIDGEVVSRGDTDGAVSRDTSDVVERLQAGRRRGRPAGSYGALTDARIVKSG